MAAKKEVTKMKELDMGKLNRICVMMRKEGQESVEVDGIKMRINPAMPPNIKSAMFG